MGLREELIQVAAVAVAIVQDMDYETTEAGDAHPELFPGGTSRVQAVLKWVERERWNQEHKWGPQHHTPEEWLAILAEEVGEAAREVYGDSVGEDLSSYAEFSMAEALWDIERFARAFLRERFGASH